MTVSPDQAAFYVGRVSHRRHKPFAHAFAYRVFSLWLDVDRIGSAAGATRLFAYNRFGLASFYDKDHGNHDGQPLRGWVETVLRQANMEPPGGPIRLLCFPRILGFVFNPLSIVFCYDPDDRLKAVVYEVHNTVGGAHAYVAPVTAPGRGTVQHTADKAFYVSPFIGMSAEYEFLLSPPGERFALTIHEREPDGPVLTAVHTGERRPFTGAQLAWLLAANPLMTIKVFGAILYEAAWLWTKGAKYRSPVVASRTVSIGRAIVQRDAVPEAAE